MFKNIGKIRFETYKLKQMSTLKCLILICVGIAIETSVIFDELKTILIIPIIVNVILLFTIV